MLPSRSLYLPCKLFLCNLFALFWDRGEGGEGVGCEGMRGGEGGCAVENALRVGGEHGQTESK